MAVVLLEDDLTIFQNQQSVDELALHNFVDRLLAPLKGNGKVIDGVSVSFDYQDAITVVFNIDRRQYFTQVAEGPAIFRSELKIGERESIRSAVLLGQGCRAAKKAGQ